MRIPDDESVVARAGEGEPPAAIVTRDSRGTLYFYSPCLAIVDLAGRSEAARPLGWTLFSVMFGASAPRSAGGAPPAALRRWLAADPARGARFARARDDGGADVLRVVVTSAPLEAGSDEADRVLAELGVESEERRRIAERRAYRARIARPALVARDERRLGSAAVHTGLAAALGLLDAETRAASD